GPDAFWKAQDVYNRSLERSVSGFNYPQFLKVTWLYDLPIGPDKFLRVPGVAGKIIGGWRLSGIHNYRSGSPISISTSGINNATGGAIRPDVVAGAQVVMDAGKPVAFGTAGSPYLNPAAFTQVPATRQNVAIRLGAAPRYLPN